jgi:hypothetical protein
MLTAHRSHVFALALCVLAASPALARADKPTFIPAKVGLELLTQNQYADLQKKMNLYAWSEAILKRCGKATHIERRMRDAVSACVHPASLDKIATQFRTLLERETKKEEDGLPCDNKVMRNILPKVKQYIEEAITEAAQMCRACLIC